MYTIYQNQIKTHKAMNPDLFIRLGKIAEISKTSHLRKKSFNKTAAAWPSFTRRSHNRAGDTVDRV